MEHSTVPNMFLHTFWRYFLSNIKIIEPKQLFLKKKNQNLAQDPPQPYTSTSGAASVYKPRKDKLFCPGWRNAQ